MATGAGWLTDAGPGPGLVKGMQGQVPWVKGNVYIWQNLLLWHVLANHSPSPVCATNQEARRAGSRDLDLARPTFNSNAGREPLVSQESGVVINLNSTVDIQTKWTRKMEPGMDQKLEDIPSEPGPMSLQPRRMSQLKNQLKRQPKRKAQQVRRPQECSKIRTQMFQIQQQEKQEHN